MLHTARVAGLANLWAPVHSRRSTGTALVRGRYGPLIRWWMHPNGAPVATGTAVGAVTDYSNRGLSITQATASKQPLKGNIKGVPCFAFDGVNDGFVTANTDFSASSQLTVVVVDYRANVSGTLELELTTDATNVASNGFAIVANDAGVNGWEAIFKSNIGLQYKNVASAAAPTQTWRAWVATANKAAPAASELFIFSRGAEVTNLALNVTSDSTNTFANAAWFIGCRANNSFFFTGSLAHVIVLTSALSKSDGSLLSLYAAQAAGVA